MDILGGVLLLLFDWDVVEVGEVELVGGGWIFLVGWGVRCGGIDGGSVDSGDVLVWGHRCLRVLQCLFVHLQFCFVLK